MVRKLGETQDLRIVRRLRITEADLVEVDVGSRDTGAIDLHEDLVAHDGLADARRSAQPQERDSVAGHRVSVSAAAAAESTKFRPAAHGSADR